MSPRNPSSLIMSLAQAKAWRDELAKAGKKLVITNGCFDLIHRGHAQYLHESRELGDALLILINSDNAVQKLKGPTRPIVPEEHRTYLLASLEAIDAVVIFDSERCNTELAELAPDIYVKGGDYTVETLDPSEREALESANTQICFKPFIEGFSTTNIVEKIKAD